MCLLASALGGGAGLGQAGLSTSLSLPTVLSHWRVFRAVPPVQLLSPGAPPERPARGPPRGGAGLFRNVFWSFEKRVRGGLLGFSLSPFFFNHGFACKKIMDHEHFSLLLKTFRCWGPSFQSFKEAC